MINLRNSISNLHFNERFYIHILIGIIIFTIILYFTYQIYKGLQPYSNSTSTNDSNLSVSSNTDTSGADGIN